MSLLPLLLLLFVPCVLGAEAPKIKALKKMWGGAGGLSDFTEKEVLGVVKLIGLEEANGAVPDKDDYHKYTILQNKIKEFQKAKPADVNLKVANARITKLIEAMS